MDLNRQKWYVRWYFWSLEICDESLDRGDTSERVVENGTNLCAFMRTILIYTPLILLFNALVYAATLATITVLPIYLFGFKGFGLSWGGLAVLGVSIYLIVLFVMWRKNKRRSRALVEKKAANTDAASPSFHRVVGQWVMAKKRKVCPLITFVQENKEVQ